MSNDMPTNKIVQTSLFPNNLLMEKSNIHLPSTEKCTLLIFCLFANYFSLVIQLHQVFHLFNAYDVIIQGMTGVLMLWVLIKEQKILSKLNKKPIHYIVWYFFLCKRIGLTHRFNRLQSLVQYCQYHIGNMRIIFHGRYVHWVIGIKRIACLVVS